MELQYLDVFNNKVRFVSIILFLYQYDYRTAISRYDVCVSITKTPLFRCASGRLGKWNSGSPLLPQREEPMQ